MGELLNQLYDGVGTGSFFVRDDVLAAEAMVTPAAKELLADIADRCARKWIGIQMDALVYTLRHAFTGQVAAVFHDIMRSEFLSSAILLELRRIEADSNPPTCKLDEYRLPLCQQLLAVAELPNEFRI